MQSLIKIWICKRLSRCFTTKKVENHRFRPSVEKVLSWSYFVTNLTGRRLFWLIWDLKFFVLFNPLSSKYDLNQSLAFFDRKKIKIKSKMIIQCLISIHLSFNSTHPPALLQRHFNTYVKSIFYVFGPLYILALIFMLVKKYSQVLVSVNWSNLSGSNISSLLQCYNEIE